jgi:two-component sensor histidine kinase
MVVPEDRPKIAFGPDDLTPGHGFLDSEFRIRRRDGEIRWLVAHTVVRRGEGDEPIEMVGLNWDITERKQAETALIGSEERLRVLVDELQHRTRNLIALVRATASTTARAARSFDEFMPKFQERLGALARAQGLLSRAQEGRLVMIDELIEAELAAHVAQTRADGRVAVEGPRGVGLPFSAVQSLALALHELVTNAVKYGALKEKGGTLRVSWRLEPFEDGDWLHVMWKEGGVQLANASCSPLRSGQGRDLIERGLPYQFRARTSFALEADGVRCTISLPMGKRGIREGGDGAR